MSRETDAETGFLSRWSKRKQQGEQAETESAPPLVERAAEQQNDADKDEHVKGDDVRALPVWQQDGVDAETKKAALRKLFRKPEFNVRDGLNEYDDDFTQFASLGNIVTHEMKRMLKLAEEKTRPDEAKQEQTQSSAAAEHTEIKPSDKEDDGIA